MNRRAAVTPPASAADPDQPPAQSESPAEAEETPDQAGLTDVLGETLDGTLTLVGDALEELVG